MWGTGVTDDLTIPSLFSNKFNVSSKNYGESAYVSRQSLVLMINEYITGGISNGKNTIVYYDGVNDVQNYCRSEIVGMATSYQSTFQGLMENSHNMFKYIYSPLIDLINKFIQKGSSYDDLYDCENNIEKAKKVAGYIVNTWKKASLIASGNNDEFVAILQPVAHISNPKINHIKKFLALGRQQELKKQYEAVYPFIRALVKKEKNIHFLDFSNIYDGKDNIYIDFCHVSPQGHMLVIDEIYNKYKKDFNL